MRFRAGLMALAAAALPPLVAAQTKPPAEPAKPAAPKAVATPASIVIGRTTVDELKKMMEADKVVVLDVRSADAYREAHIPGAVSAPLAELDKHVAMLKSAKKTIVAYCT